MNRKKVELKNYNIIITIIFLLLVFFMWYGFRCSTIFDTDELDIYAGGEAIAGGLTLYKDFFSQHMPFSYYISALFWKVGASSVSTQRFSFYLFFSISWAIIFFKYSKQKNILLIPTTFILFVSTITTYPFGETILSEHIAAIGLIIIWLEFEEFEKTGHIKIESCIAISIAILLAFGTIFLAVFPLFIILIGVIIIGIERSKKGINTRKEYMHLILAVLIPWILFLLSQIMKNNLENTIYGTYTWNVDVYSNYIPSGTNVSDAVFAGLSNYYCTVLDAVRGVVHPTGVYFLYSRLICLFLIGLSFAYLCWLFYQKKYIVATIGVLFLLELSIRGIFSFHGTHCVAIMCLFSSEFIIITTNRFRKKWPKAVVIGGVLLFFMVGYINQLDAYPNSLHLPKREEIKMIDACTNLDEPVWNLTLANNNLFIRAERMQEKNIGAVPWAWDAYGERVLKEYGDNPPRVAYFNKKNDCWGYSLDNYAKPLVAYVENNYVQYKDTFLYLRKDVYNELKNKIEKGN